MADKVNKKAAERAKLIEQNQARLYSKKASERRDAAQWLGEAAAAEAIPDLVRVYQTDRDSGVRAAAAYALGQFRAIEQAVANGQQAKVEDLLHKVEVEGKYGSRGGRGRWTRIALGLLLSFAIFGGLALVLYGGIRGIQAAVQSAVPVSTVAQPTPNLDEVAVYAADLRSAFAPISADITTLQAQFTTVLAGDVPDCGAFFNQAPPFALPAETETQYPELAALATRINEMQASFDQAHAAFMAACQSGTPLNAATAGSAYAALRLAITALPQMEAALNTLSLLLTPTPTGMPTSTATPPPSVTPTPLVTAVPTTNPQLTDPRSHLNALYLLIDQMAGPGGQAVVLRDYWGEALRVNRPAGCGARPPEAPDPYVISEAEAAASPELATAVDLVNNGLEQVRLGWSNFFFTCGSNTVGASAIQGQLEVGAAITAFESARTLLDAVAGS